MLDSRRDESQPRHRRVAREGEDDRTLPRARLRRARLLRPRPRPAREPREGQVRRGRGPRLRARVRDPRGSPEARRRDRAGGANRRPDLPRDRPRSRGRGDRLARRGGGHVPAGQARAGHLQRDHEPAIRMPSPIRGRSTGPRRRAAGAPDRRSARGVHAEPAHLAQGARGPLGRAGPVGRRAPRRGARAGDRGLPRPRVLDDRATLLDAPGGDASRPTSSGSTEPSRRDRRWRHGRGATSRPCAGRPLVTEVGTKKSKRSPAPPFTTSTLQQEASRKLGFSPKRTMSVAQRLYEGVDTPDGHVGLITYMRTDSVAMAGQALGEAREVIAARFGDAYTMPKGRVYRTKSKSAQEAHEAIRPTRSPAIPRRSPALLRPRRGPPLPPDLAACPRQPDEGEGARDDDGRPGRRARTCSARAPPGRSSTASRASTRRGVTRRRGRRGGRPAAARRRRPARRSPGRPDAALHGAAAPLHGGKPDQGPRGERDRPAVHLRRDDLHDRGSRLRPVRERRLHPEPWPRWSRISSSTTSGSTSISPSRPGWRRSSTRSPAASAPGCRSWRRSTARSGPGWTRSGASCGGRTSPPRRRTRSARRVTRW